jgi:hypothetical protein
MEDTGGGAMDPRTQQTMSEAEQFYETVTRGDEGDYYEVTKPEILQALVKQVVSGELPTGPYKGDPTVQWPGPK